MHYMRTLVRVMILLLIISTLTGCDAGWSICGWEVK